MSADNASKGSIPNPGIVNAATADRFRQRSGMSDSRAVKWWSTNPPHRGDRFRSILGVRKGRQRQESDIEGRPVFGNLVSRNEKSARRRSRNESRNRVAAFPWGRWLRTTSSPS